MFLFSTYIAGPSQAGREASRVEIFFFFTQFSAKQIKQGQSTVSLWGPSQAADQPEIRDPLLEVVT